MPSISHMPLHKLRFFIFLRREILTSSGIKILFKYLCLCHGARPKMIEGKNEFVIGIRDTESVQEVRMPFFLWNGSLLSNFILFIAPVTSIRGPQNWDSWKRRDCN